MPWTDTGTVNVTRTAGPGLHRIRFQWESGASGAVLNMPESINGVLDHFRSTERDGSSTYDVYLHSKLDVDVLNGQGVGLTVDSTTNPVMIRKLLDATDRPRPILVMGRHTFRCTEANDHGVLDLFYWPDVRKALAERLMR